MRFVLVKGVSLFALALAIILSARADQRPGVERNQRIILALAKDHQLRMLVGQYDPQEKKWFSNTEPFIPPPPGATFSLFNVRGKVADVHLTDPFKTPNWQTPWLWTPSISPWDRKDSSLALGLSGAWEAPRHVPRFLPLDDPESKRLVSEFLKERHLDVPDPRLTQVLGITLNQDGNEAFLICANSDRSGLSDGKSASIYALALLRRTVDGQTITLPLRTAASFKPAHQTVDEHERRHGAMGSYEILALVDVDGDGTEEIALSNDVSTGPEVDVFSLEGKTVRKVLSASLVYF